jgi:release factor glutamine methyltransferase
MSAPLTHADEEILRKILHVILPVPQRIYAPREDSFLMLDVLSTLPVEKKDVLDVGTGSGILGLYCAMRGAYVTISDNDEKALRYAQTAAQTLGVSLNALVSDLFSNISGQFNLVIFNPPYLPSTNREDRTVDGGNAGAKLAREFLKGLGGHLKADGFALLLLSSLNDSTSLLAEYPEYDFSVSAKRGLFFEELRVFRLKLRGKSSC